MNDHFKEFLQNSKFKHHLSFYVNTRPFSSVEIKVDIHKGYPRYLMTIQIENKKLLQFTFNDKYVISPRQKTKYSKVESEILSIFERAIVSNHYYIF